MVCFLVTILATMTMLLSAMNVLRICLVLLVWLDFSLGCVC